MRRPRPFGAPEAPAAPEPSTSSSATASSRSTSRPGSPCCDERRAGLTRTEFDLLVDPAARPGRVFERDTLFRTVWGTSWVGDGHLVEVHMGNLRRKLGDPSKDGRYIRTVRGVGYRLEEPVPQA